MIRCTLIDDGQLRLALNFDTPMPNSVESHEEFSRFWSKASGLDGFREKRNDGSLVGFSLPVSELQTMIAGNDKELEAFNVFFSDLDAAGLESSEPGLDVNFHQKPFDTPERQWAFLLNQTPFLPYLLNRVYWDLAPKLKRIAPFPLHVDIETANTCNMNCPMCYRDMMKETGQMDFDLFTKGVDECVEHGVYSLRLSWRGEPLTHPRICEMIEYASARIPNVSLLTNSFFLDETISQQMIDAGLTYLAVSFDGVEDVYEAIRHPAKFMDSRQRLVDLRAMREAAGKVHPQVRLCTIWPAIKADPDNYVRLMAPVSDAMVYNPYINFKGEMRIKDDFICQYPWQRIMVAYNGDVQCCTGWNAGDIVLGNLRDNSIAHYWNCDQLQDIRAKHAAGDRMSLASCSACRHGSEGDVDADIWEIVKRRY